MLDGRPLYDTAADHRFFVAPSAAWPQLRTAVEKGFNTALVGPRGAGKTTLLRQLLLQLRDATKRPAPVFVDATAADTPLDLLDSIRDALEVRGNPVFPHQQPGATSAHLVQQVRELGDHAARHILVDASGAGDAAYHLFGRLRDELWQLPHRWVVAIEEEDRATLLRPPADAFFDVTIALAGLERTELVEMLERRDPTLSAESREMIAAESKGNPRLALQAARQSVVEATDPGKVLARRARIEAAASALGRPHSMLMAELQALGSASASDADLLRRLGWTRERATQVLGELEEGGLVIASQERQARGRPRKVYRPAEDVP